MLFSGSRKRGHGLAPLSPCGPSLTLGVELPLDAFFRRGTNGSNPFPSSGESRPKIFGASSIKRLSLMDRLGVRRTMALSPAVAVAGESWAAVRGVYRTSPSPPITTGCCAATHRRLCQRRTQDHEARASTGQTDRGAAAGIGGPRLAQPARKSATSLANSAGSLHLWHVTAVLDDDKPRARDSIGGAGRRSRGSLRGGPRSTVCETPGFMLHPSASAARPPAMTNVLRAGAGE